MTRTAVIAPERSLNALTSQFHPLAITLIARLAERGVPVLIVQTIRTVQEQATALATGHSSISNSKHLPRTLRGITHGTADDGKADAMDLVPYDVYQASGPDTLDWSDADTTPHARLFAAIGEEAEILGLRWGGRWHTPHDPGHVELDPVPLT